MKSILLSITLAALLPTAKAANKNQEPKSMCQNVAEKAAAKADFEMFGAEASSCGSKLLHLGDELETYLVCVSDETDPSEWIVVVKRFVTNKNHKVVSQCHVEYTGYAVDAATPDFKN